MFKKLGEIFDYKNLSNVRIDFESMQVFILLTTYGNNKSQKFRNCYTKLDKIIGNFEVKFCFHSISEIQSMTQDYLDSYYIERNIIQLSKRYEFFVCENFYDDNFSYKLIDINKTLLQCAENKKRENRIRNFKNNLINEFRITKLKNKSDLENTKIFISYREVLELIYNFNKLSPVYLEFLKNNCTLTTESIYLAMNKNASLESILFFESLGLVFEKTDQYNNLIKLDIFNNLG